MQFQSFNIYVENKFLYDLMEKKINDYKLSESKQPIYGKYTNNHTSSSILSFDEKSLSNEQNNQSSHDFIIHGDLHVFNTLNAYKKNLKANHLTNLGNEIINAPLNNLLEDPSLLYRVLLLCYVDAKSYKIHHLFGIPTFIIPNIEISSNIIPITKINQNMILDINSYLENNRECAFALIILTIMFMI